MKLVFIMLLFFQLFFQLPAIAETNDWVDDWVAQNCAKYFPEPGCHEYLTEALAKVLSEPSGYNCEVFPIESHEGMTKGACLLLYSGFLVLRVERAVVEYCDRFPSKKNCLEDLTGQEISDVAFKACNKLPIVEPTEVTDQATNQTACFQKEMSFRKAMTEHEVVLKSLLTLPIISTISFSNYTIFR